MLATLADKPFDSPDWLFELKMDGIRALVVKDGEKFEMWTRNDRPLHGALSNPRSSPHGIARRFGRSGR